MDAFIRRNLNFLVSLSYLTFGIWLFGYSTIYMRNDSGLKQAGAVDQLMRAENDKLKAMAKERDERRAAGNAAGLQSLPTFLGHINAIASQTKVIIRELTPSHDSSLKFVLKLTADYFTFLRFLSELEALNVIVNDLQIHPYDPRKTPPEHAIEFSITPRGNGDPLPNANERISALREQVAEPNKRNPFQRFAFDKANNEVSKDIELTWLYRLTGVGRIGDHRIATINGQDYGVGDSLDGMVIGAIDSDRVMLKKDSKELGSVRYVLKFRPSSATKQ